MATWGEFLKEFKIVNQKGQVLVRSDEVLDVWEERNKLRVEVVQLREEAARLREQVAQMRETCAQELEEYAQACAKEPDQPEYLAQVLQAAAGLVRSGGQMPAAEEVPASQSEAVPTAEAVTSAGEEDIPTGIAVGEVSASESLPVAEAIPLADQVPPGEEGQS